MNARATRVELRIERLVVDGVPLADQARFGRAVERELARLIAERGAPAGVQRTGSAAWLDAGTLVPGAAGDDRLASALASALYQGLNR